MDALSRLMDEVVEKQSEIDAVIFYDLKNGLPLLHSTISTGRGSNLPKLLFELNDSGDAMADFSDISGVRGALSSFGSSSELGELRFTIFNLSRGLLQVYFREFDILTALCFVSADNRSMARFMLQCERSARPIFDLYKAEVEPIYPVRLA